MRRDRIEALADSFLTATAQQHPPATFQTKVGALQSAAAIRNVLDMAFRAGNLTPEDVGSVQGPDSIEPGRIDRAAATLKRDMALLDRMMVEMKDRLSRI